MKELAKKILSDKMNGRVDFINKQAPRPFDNKIDTISFSLTPKQFYVVKKAFNLKEIQVLCQGIKIDTFAFGDYTIIPHYNDRMGIYELMAKHKDYIDDFEERENYLGFLFGEEL